MTMLVVMPVLSYGLLGTLVQGWSGKGIALLKSELPRQVLRHEIANIPLLLSLISGFAVVADVQALAFVLAVGAQAYGFIH